MAKKKEHDFTVAAFRVVQEAAHEIESSGKKPFDAKAMGRKGGLKNDVIRA